MGRRGTTESEEDTQQGQCGDQSPCFPPRPAVHDLLVASGSTKGHERKAAGGCMVQGHPNAPKIHGHPECLLLGLPKHGPLIHVRVLPERSREQP